MVPKIEEYVNQPVKLEHIQYIIKSTVDTGKIYIRFVDKKTQTTIWIYENISDRDIEYEKIAKQFKDV